jgi:hypothetical protein
MSELRDDWEHPDVLALPTLPVRRRAVVSGLLVVACTFGAACSNAAAADAGARAATTIRDLPLTPLWAGRVAPDQARPLSSRDAAATIAAAKPDVPWPTGPGGATAADDD